MRDQGGTATLSFKLDEQEYRWRGRYDNEWLDLNILAQTRWLDD